MLRDVHAFPSFEKVVGYYEELAPEAQVSEHIHE